MKGHLSSEQISRWIVGERTNEEERHATVCPQCRAELDHLENALSLFRDSGQRWSDHWYRSARQNDSIDAQHGAGQRSLQWGKRSLAGVLATSVCVAAFLIHWPVPVPVARPVETPHAFSGRPFIRLPYVAAPAPYERTEVMRMDVPITALIAVGLEVHVPDVGAAVRADVLVGQDGRALAIRLVPGSIARSDRRDYKP
jgi:hypothetical protein